MLLTKEGLTGLWRLSSDKCRALRIFFDEGSGTVRAQLLYWKRGRLGCSTRSSDIGEVELQASESEGWDLVLNGSLPANSPGQILGPFAVSMQLKARGSANGLVSDFDGTSYPVTLEMIDSLPPFDLAAD
jgi:hypothetical protein